MDAWPSTQAGGPAPALLPQGIRWHYAWIGSMLRATAHPTAFVREQRADHMHGVQEYVRSFLSTRMHPLMRAAQLTPRYSGSDLVEVCKHAARHCVLENMARAAPHRAPADGEHAPAAEGASSATNGTASAAARRGVSSAASALAAAGNDVARWVVQPWLERDSAAALDDTPPPAAAAAPASPLVPPEATLTEAVLLKCVAEVRRWWRADALWLLRRLSLVPMHAGESGGQHGEAELYAV
jgi:hypothetical protein